MATPSIDQLIARVQNLEDLTIPKIYELSHATSTKHTINGFTANTTLSLP
jgi:hypothetical protein